MRKLLAVLAAAVAVVTTQAAQAGGWATVRLAPPPASLDADDTWNARLTVLRHGRTPTDGAAPFVTIRGSGGAVRTYPATPAGATGVYVARVVFPEGGTWRYEANDGLAATGYGVSQTHTFGTADIAPGTGAGGTPVWPFGLAAIALVLVAATALVRQRNRRPAPQSS